MNELQVELLGTPKDSLTGVGLPTQALGPWVWGREQEGVVTPRVPASVRMA